LRRRQTIEGEGEDAEDGEGEIGEIGEAVRLDVQNIYKVIKY